MGETEKDFQTNSDDPRGGGDSPDTRRAYVAPEVTALELLSVIKGIGGSNPDGHAQTRPPG